MGSTKTYEWVLFDADETLFHFDAYRGLKFMFSRYGVEFTRSDYEDYQKVNRALWVDYQNQVISASQLQVIRFENWATRLSILPQELNRSFLSAMADICTPLDGAVSLLDSLKHRVKLGLITNGFTALQRVRLERTGLSHYFETIVVSEEVGFAKPQREIFDYALSSMGHPLREQVLMVGDTLESDILGGDRAGLDTCWLNIHQKSLSEGIRPSYQVSSLKELETLLNGLG